MMVGLDRGIEAVMVGFEGLDGFEGAVILDGRAGAKWKLCG